MRRPIMLWLASLVLVAAVAAALTAQAPQPRSPGQPPESRVVSGADLGFRVEGFDPSTGRPTGRFVIQIDGEWVEVGFQPVPRRLH